MRLLPTDEQVIANVRRWQRHRRPVGVACLVLGVAAVIGFLYLANNMQAKALELLTLLNPPHNPTTREIQESIDRTKFNIGFAAGFVVAEGLAGGATLAAAGLVWLLVRNRKDHLLLKCWDEDRGGE